MLSETFSNWNLIRVSGFLAFFLFTLSIAAGLIGRFSALKKNKPFMLELHQASGWIGFLAVVFHGLLLLNDHYAPYTWKELFIPLLSKNEPFLSGLGTISFYLFFFTIFTSDFLMKSLGKPLWKKIHFLILPAWVLMLLHGILIGTDSKEPWASGLYGGSIILISILLILRFLDNPLKKNKTQSSNTPIEKAP
ncbi:ferric reductase-like transmembrane domain-containing protein [Cytobacillus sp. Hz8]|uniref:ferric reductase-like transmembrane domain-containing protein n=1 Tax=Cytobacillus sp. Hz8 TaxID=3347168 RepID=UPI0035D61277